MISKSSANALELEGRLLRANEAELRFALANPTPVAARYGLPKKTVLSLVKKCLNEKTAKKERLVG